MRDEIAPEAQARLDGVALDLAARLDAPGLDPTRAPTDPGLFTDDGALASASFENGLSARLRVNAAVDPDQGGAVWRLRDGVGAAAEGTTGDPTLLRGLLAGVQAKQPTLSASYSGTSRTLSELSADLLSLTAMDRQFADAKQAESASKFSALKEMELSRGVDTDAQMQRLLEIENAYAANARVAEHARRHDEPIAGVIGMSIPSTGDLARSFFLRQSHERVRGDLSTLTRELSSGTHADMGRALKGDFTALAGVERGLRLFESYTAAAADAALTTAAAQAALQAVQDSLGEIRARAAFGSRLRQLAADGPRGGKRAGPAFRHGVGAEPVGGGAVSVRRRRDRQRCAGPDGRYHGRAGTARRRAPRTRRA